MPPEDPLDWPNAGVVSGDAVDVVARLKEESKVPLRSHGSFSRMLPAGSPRCRRADPGRTRRGRLRRPALPRHEQPQPHQRPSSRRTLGLKAGEQLRGLIEGRDLEQSQLTLESSLIVPGSTERAAAR